jgi:hypothetical protein
MRASSGFGRMLALVGSLAGALMLSISTPVDAQSYKQQNLVSDLPGIAPTMDPHLVNPWGIVFHPTGLSGFPITMPAFPLCTMGTGTRFPPPPPWL